MKIYNDYNEIKKDLKVLELRRNIALEKMKLLGNETKDELTPNNWSSSTFMSIGKVSLPFLLKRFFK